MPIYTVTTFASFVSWNLKQLYSGFKGPAVVDVMSRGWYVAACEPILALFEFQILFGRYTAENSSLILFNFDAHLKFKSHLQL